MYFNESLIVIYQIYVLGISFQITKKREKKSNGLTTRWSTFPGAGPVFFIARQSSLTLIFPILPLILYDYKTLFQLIKFFNFNTFMLFSINKKSL